MGSISLLVSIVLLLQAGALAAASRPSSIAGKYEHDEIRGRVTEEEDRMEVSVTLLESAESVAEILGKNGLPEGLLPETVTNYELEDSGKFKVTLASTCTTKIGAEEVSYKKSISGVLSYGKIKNLSGIQAHEFFWVSVTGIEMDSSNPNVIWFKVGWLSKSLSTDYFQVSPTCNSLADQNDTNEKSMPFSTWLFKALRGTLKTNVATL